MRRTVAGIVLVGWVCAVAPAQSTSSEFEVISIRRSTQPGAGPIRLGQSGGPGSANPGRVTYTLCTIRDLIMDAYDAKPNQVSGGPSWVDTERFDIVAKVPTGATKEQVKVMLQNLLADRFKLRLHRESRELPVYLLVVGSKGPKLRDSDASAEVQSPERHGISGMKLARDGCPETPPRAARPGASFTVMTPNGECMLANGQTMERFANELSKRFDRLVIDQTGLKGTYDVRLRYDPSSMPGRRGGPMAKDTRDDPNPANHAAADGDSLSIFNALTEQLGLKLESKKAPVDLLLIDRVEKTPAQN